MSGWESLGIGESLETAGVRSLEKEGDVMALTPVGTSMGTVKFMFVYSL